MQNHMQVPTLLLQTVPLEMWTETEPSASFFVKLIVSCKQKDIFFDHCKTAHFACIRISFRVICFVNKIGLI